MKSPRVVILGGSGFLGRGLANYLAARDHEVVIVSRNAPRAPGPWVHARWDGRSMGESARHVDSAAGVVNLAGRSVDCRKTPENCDEILRSRVEATLALGEAVRSAVRPPPVWVQMSTAHRYGDPQDVRIDEGSSFGYGLAPFVGAAWEAAFADAAPPDIRKVTLRTSFVLGRNAGALRRLERVARWGLGGTIGHGRQGISWIHEEDMNRLFLRALTDPSMSGAYIATAPRPRFQRRVHARVAARAPRPPRLAGRGLDGQACRSRTPHRPGAGDPRALLCIEAARERTVRVRLSGARWCVAQPVWPRRWSIARPSI